MPAVLSSSISPSPDVGRHKPCSVCFLGWRAQIYLQLRHDLFTYVFRNLGEQIRNQVLLPALAENHAVDCQRAAQSVQTLYFTAEWQCRNVPLDLCITGEKPISYEIIFLYRSTCAT